jgi:plasmid maintenance system antidote protein VapI
MGLKRSITADTALRLSQFFGTSPQFWLNLQTRFDLENEKDKSLHRIESEIRPFNEKAA